jgi:hypothetical protein
MKIKSASMLMLALMLAFFTACVTPPPAPTWNPVTAEIEAEYAPYLKTGSGSLSGQAFLNQRNGGVVKAAGQNVVLDPATTLGNEWWGKAGKLWVHRMLTPPSPAFAKARRTAVADADGKFRFTNLPAGKYYVHTEVTWEVAYIGPQGGIVGQLIEVTDGTPAEVILNQMPQ